MPAPPALAPFGEGPSPRSGLTPLAPRHIRVWLLLRAELPGYRIRVETAPARRPRYIATADSLSRHPHTLVTADPDELRATLISPAGSPPGPPAKAPRT